MPPKVAKKKPAASANATSSARKPKSSLSSTTTKKISPPVSSLPGRPVTKQPRRTMNSASSSFDFSAFDGAPSQSTTDQQQEEEEGEGQGEEGTTEFESDSGFREDEEDEDGNLSPTHEAFYPFPLPPNLNENEDLPSNSVGYQVPQLNLEPPTPAKVDNNEKQVKVVEMSPEPSADTIAPQANVSSDEQAVDTTAATVESQQNEDATMDPVPKEEIKSEEMEQDSNPTAQETSIPSEAALQAESLVPPSSPLSDAPPSSRAGLDDQPSQEADVSSSEMQIDPIKTEEEDSKPPVQDEASTSQTNVIDATSASDNAIKDEMLQSLLSAIGKGKEKETENENPEGTSSQDVVDEVDQMDPDFWEVEKRPSQKKMEEVRRINALRDWDKECDEMLGYERAEKERKQNDWQNQKSIRVRAEEKREMDREKGIFTSEDHYDRYDDVGSGKRGGGRGRGRDPRDRGSSKRGRGGGPPPRDPRGFVPRGDSPPRFPYSTATQIPPPSASYQPVAQPQSASQFSSNALASLTSQFATDDAKAKLAALQAQISAQPDLFNSLLAKIAAPAPPAANDGYGSNSYSQAQTQALAQVSGSYYQQPPPGSSIPVANHQSYSSPDPYGRNERAPLPPQSSLGNDPYGRSQESRDPRDAYRSTTNDYRNDTSRFPSQDPYARARSPTSTYQTNGNHLDPYGRIGSNNGLSNSRDPYSSNPMLSSSPSRPYSPNPNVGLYSSPIPNQGSDPYSNRNSNPYDRNPVMTDPYRAPPPASVNGWGAPPQPPQSVVDPYSRGYPGPPPSLPDNTPAPQVTGYGARSTNAGASSGRYEDDRDRGYRGGDPYRGASRGRGGRGGQRESKTKRMMS